MSWFSGLFGHKSNPYEAAAPFMEQVPGQLHQYYDPYVSMGQTGVEQLGQLGDIYGGLLPGLQTNQQLTGAYQQMALNPGAYQQQLGSAFQADPGYQWNLDQQLKAAAQAQAAGGMAGSPQHMQFAQQLAGNLANQQYQDYLGRQLGISGMGLGGLQQQQQAQMGLGQTALQGLSDIASKNLGYGFDASQQMAQNMQDYLYNRANLASQGKQFITNQKHALLGGALGLGANLLGAL